VLDHCGGPIGRGRFANRREETIFRMEGIDPGIAKCPNVVVKLGGWRCVCSGMIFTSVRCRHRRRSGGVAPLYRSLHRGLRPRALHVREQLSAGQRACSYQVIFNAFNASPPNTAKREDGVVSRTATDFYRLEAGVMANTEVRVSKNSAPPYVFDSTVRRTGFARWIEHAATTAEAAISRKNWGSTM